MAAAPKKLEGAACDLLVIGKTEEGGSQGEFPILIIDCVKRFEEAVPPFKLLKKPLLLTGPPKT